MKYSSRTKQLGVLVALVTTISLLLPPVAHGQWETVGNGIDYRYFRIESPQNDVFVTRMDRSNSNAIIDSSIGQSRIHGEADTWETVSGMANRYDEAINFWGQQWGKRNKVVVAINGDYYWNQPSHPDPYKSQSGQIHSGWFCRRFMEWSGGSGFVWKIDRSCFLGGNVTNGEKYQTTTQVIHFQSGTTTKLDTLNNERGTGELALYTPQYADRTYTSDDGVEVLVEMSRPTLPIVNVEGTVKAVYENKGSNFIPFDHVILSGEGAAGNSLKNNAPVGSKVQIQLDLKDYDNRDWTKAYASIGGHVYLVKNGIVKGRPGDTAIHPRTAVGFNDSYVFFVVVDGRSARSTGMTFDALASFCRHTLGITWTISQDGGGSSTLVVNGKVKNVPSDGQERRVANGYLMVNVLDMEKSVLLKEDQEIQILSNTEMRLGPGENFGVLAQIVSGETGTITHHPLNGVLAKGKHWWKVKSGTQEGWIEQNALISGVPQQGVLQVR